MRWPLLVPVLLLAGCLTPEVKPPVVVVPPTGPATSAQIVALEEQIAQQKELTQRAAGAVFGATDANQHNPAGLPKEATDAQLQEAASALPQPTDAQRAEKANQNARILAGQLAAVKAEMGLKISENETLRQKLEDTDKRLIALTNAAEKERAEAAAKLQAQFDSSAEKLAAKEKEIQDLKASWTRNTQMWTARILVIAGVLVVASGAVVVWLSGLAALGKAGGIAVSGLLLVGSGLIVGHRLFLPIAGGSLLLALLCGAWYLWHVRRTQQIARGATYAIQDVKDAAAAGSESAAKAAAELKEALLYRFPRTPDGEASVLEKEIDRRLVAEGINTR